MPRPCDHPEGPTSPGTCNVCWLYETSDGHRQLWGGPPLVKRTHGLARKSGRPWKPRLTIAEIVAKRRDCPGCQKKFEESKTLKERREGMEWAYGVTTVPERRKDLLPQTLQSLALAGFPKPRLFVDACDGQTAVEMETRFRLEVTPRYPRLRTHGNWILSLYELYIRQPHADRYAVFQDDFVTYPNLRQYLEKCQYNEGGYWNLYTFPSNQQLCPKDARGKDKVGWYLSNQFGRGAVALVFSHLAVLTLLSARHMLERPMDPDRGWKAVDGGIVDSFRKAGWKEWVHNPSLVQHLGEQSVTVPGKNPQLQAVSYRGENYNALDLLKENVTV